MFKIKINKLGKPVYFEEDDKLLDGTHPKDFVMFREKDFKELTSEKSKTDKFITYIDNIRQEGLSPKNVSVLNKSVWSEDSAVNEVIASRLMSFFGCPTVFNVSYVEDGKKDQKKCYYVASVDCISENETFENFYRLVALSDDRVYTLWRRIESFLTIKFSDYPDFDKRLKGVEEDFFRSHIVREFVVGDYDSGSHNIGLLLNEKEKNFQIVNFDYEAAFVTRKRELSDFNLKYTVDHKPHLLKEIYDKAVILRDALSTIGKDAKWSDNKDVNNIVNEKIEKLIINLDYFISAYREEVNLPIK